LEAAVLSAAGVTGPAHALEGDAGFASLHGGRSARSFEIAADPDSWRLPDTRFKYHASCFLTHSAIEAARLIAARTNGRVEGIESVEVLVSPTAADVCDRSAPQDGLEAKFSLQATVAMTLSGIETADPASFDDATLRAPGLAELMACIHVEVDERGGLTATRLRARRGDGSVIERDWDADRPERDLAIQGEQLQRKFNILVGTTLAPGQARRMIDAVDRLAELQTLAPIGAGLRSDGQSNPGQRGEV
jgi:2-methylcitrate dehydratase PrpD